MIYYTIQILNRFLNITSAPEKFSVSSTKLLMSTSVEIGIFESFSFRISKRVVSFGNGT